MTELLFSQRSFTSLCCFPSWSVLTSEKTRNTHRKLVSKLSDLAFFEEQYLKCDHQIHQLVLHLVSFVSVGETPYCHGQSGVSCKIYFVECILKFFENYSIRLRSQNTQDPKIAYESGHLE